MCESFPISKLVISESYMLLWADPENHFPLKLHSVFFQSPGCSVIFQTQLFFIPLTAQLRALLPHMLKIPADSDSLTFAVVMVRMCRLCMCSLKHT